VFGDVASEVLRKQGRSLSPVEQGMAQRLAQEIKRSLPATAPASQVQAATILAVSAALGLTVALVPEPAQ
jgi:hypothetical protein